MWVITNDFCLKTANLKKMTIMVVSFMHVFQFGAHWWPSLKGAVSIALVVT